MPGAAGERIGEMPARAQFLGRLGTVLLGSSQPACLVVAEKFRTKTVTNAYR